MALVNCPECGKEISSNAKTCPHCGCEITVCPDCNSVFTTHPEQCPSCGHIFNYSTNSEEQTIQDDFRDYIKGKLSLAKILQFVQIGAALVGIVFFIILIITFATLPKGDPFELLFALSKAEQTGKAMVIVVCVIDGLVQASTYVFNTRCNILHKLAANEMSLMEIDGAKYCYDHQNILNNVSKKANEWDFALNAAYRQADKSADKYNILIVVVGVAFAIIQVVCLVTVFYPFVDKMISSIANEQELNFFEGLNYVAIAIYLISAVAEACITHKLLNKYTENLKRWCNEKSLPVKFK